MLPPDREADWQRRLPRINLRGEPIAMQLLRIRNLNLVLTAVAALIGAIPLAIFTAFGHAGIGLVVLLVWMIPIGVKWLGYRSLKKTTVSYMKSRDM